MLNRREFGKVSISALAALSTSKLFAASAKPLGVQLYTVRRQIDDLPEVLHSIRQIGYTEVETYSGLYQSYSAKDLRQLITDNGLGIPSGHFEYDTFAAHFDYAATLSLKYMVCPMLPQSMWNLDGFKKAADQFNKWAPEVEKRGMKFAFHNHNYEFHQYGNTTGFDTLMANTDAKHVFIEMDCYWMTQAGRDPLKMLKAYPERIRMLHLKDRKPGFPPSQELNDAAGHFTEVGSGTIDWKAILAQAEKNHVDYMFVEQDQTDRPVFESLRISYDYLRKLLS